MYSSKWEIRVGLFAFGALLLLLFGFGWLKSFSLFSQPQRFTVRFTDVAGLSNNATINVQGVRVGTVEKIQFVDTQDEGKMVDVKIKITNESLRVPKAATITIQTIGLVGAKYIECTLPLGKPDPSSPEWQPLTEADIVRGQDPVRVELVVNTVATKVNEIVSHIDSESAGRAIKNLTAASEKLNKNMDKIARVSDSVEDASVNISATSQKFGRTAESATAASERAGTFFVTGNTTLHDISAVAKDFQGTSSRVNKLLNNPNFSGDLKETLTQARMTADTISGAMRDFNTTLKDKPLRDEMLTILTRLQNSTENIKQSMEIVNKVSTGEGLRADLKELVGNAKEAMDSAKAILGDPAFKDDIKEAIVKVRSAATNVDVVAKQIRQVLSKRAPLLQLLLGRPGKIKEEEAPKPNPTVAPAPSTAVPTPPSAVPQAPVPGR